MLLISWKIINFPGLRSFFCCWFFGMQTGPSPVVRQIEVGAMSLCLIPAVSGCVWREPASIDRMASLLP